MTTWVQDVRYAVRQLRRSPGFTLVTLLTLAAGIGANAAIFSVVDTVLLRPLGYRDADRIFAVNTRFPQANRAIPRVGGDDFADLAASMQSVASSAYYQPYESGVQVDGRGVYLKLAGVSRSFGEVLGVQPAAGRLFLRTGDVTTEALVGSSFARQHFGSEASAVGKVLQFAGAPRTVVGVLPDGFGFPESTVLWLGLPDRPETPARSAYNQRAIFRLHDGVSPAALAAELGTLSRRLAAAYPEDRQKELIAVPLQEQIVGKVRPMLRLLMGAVTLVLIIVCANITHLQLVRATAQEQRTALLNALGASRVRLMTTAVIQAALLAVAGGVGGILLGIPLIKLLLRLAPENLPRIAELQRSGLLPDATVLALCFSVSLLVMLLTAMLPIWRSWHVDPVNALKRDASRGMTPGGTARLRSMLVVGEVALTFVLCVASALLMRQMQNLAKTDLGFRPEHLLLADTHAPSSEKDGIDHAGRLNLLLDQVHALPGVEAAGAVLAAPSQGAPDVGYAIRGRTQFIAGANLPSANILPATPGYFGTMGIPLLQGRNLQATDTATAPRVAVITRSMAQQSFSGEDPLGKQIMCGYDSAGEWLTIVGVVGDAIQESPAVKAGPSFYVPLAQHPRAAADVQIVVRTHSDPAPMLDTLIKRIRLIDPSIAVTASTMHDSLGESLRTERFRSVLFGGFAFLSILLAAVGMYGVTAYTVAQRRFEFGLRFAFGARPGQVFAGVLRSSLLLAAVGIACGSVAALLLTRLAASMLTGVQAMELMPWIGAALAVLLLMLIATLLPAGRAAKVEPMQALRAE